MEIIEPLKKGFTVYGKSGCFNCTKTKRLLETNNLSFIVVDCDDYIIEDKNLFLSLMKDKIGKSYNTFPMVFNNSIFIGGYYETNEYVEKTLLSFEDKF
jgi:glutaredoxin